MLAEPQTSVGGVLLTGQTSLSGGYTERKPRKTRAMQVLPVQVHPGLGRHGSAWGGEGGAPTGVGGGLRSGVVETNCEKLRGNCGKLREIAGKWRHCKQPSVTLKVQQFWTGGSDFSFQSYKRSMGSTITGGAPQYHHGIEA